MRVDQDHSSNSLSGPLRSGAFLAVAGGLLLLSSVWALQEEVNDDPIVLRPAPNKKSVPVRVPPGEPLLVGFLQDVASFTGKSVYIQGDIRPDARISIKSHVKKLDGDTTLSLLEENGYRISKQKYRGQSVFWVQKLLTPPRKKGGLRPSGGLNGRSAAADGVDRASIERPAVHGGQSASLYRRQDGRGSRYIVVFETDSQAAAEEALSLLKAHERGWQKKMSND